MFCRRERSARGGSRSKHNWRENVNIYSFCRSVADLWHFSTVRIRILGSLLLQADPASDPALFVSDLQDDKFIWLFLFELTFTLFFKNKRSQRSHITVGIKGCYPIFAWWFKDPDPYPRLADPDPRGLKSFGSGSATLFLRKNITVPKSLQTYTLWFQCLISAGRLCSPRTWSWNAANG